MPWPEAMKRSGLPTLSESTSALVVSVGTLERTILPSARFSTLRFFLSSSYQTPWVIISEANCVPEATFLMMRGLVSEAMSRAFAAS